MTSQGPGSSGRSSASVPRFQTFSTWFRHSRESGNPEIPTFRPVAPLFKPGAGSGPPLSRGRRYETRGGGDQDGGGGDGRVVARARGLAVERARMRQGAGGPRLRGAGYRRRA